MNGKLEAKDVVNWVRGLTYSKNDEVKVTAFLYCAQLILI